MRATLLPLAVLPSTSYETHGSWTGAALTTLQPGLTYRIFLGFTPS